MKRGNYIIKHISLNYDCKCDIRDTNYELIEGNIPEEFRSITQKSKNTVMDGKAVVDLKYKNSGVDAILTYPIYIDNKYMGIISIVKNYDSSYRNYKNTINIINIIELGTFIIIFYIFISKDK